MGSGDLAAARWFSERYTLTVPLLIDPELHIYRALSMNRSWLRLIHPRVLKHAARASAEGLTQGRTRGDVQQLGGVVLLGPEGDVRWAHRDGEPGDLADLDDGLRAAKALT